VTLAGFGMKFSSLAIGCFLLARLATVDLLLAAALAGTVLATVGMNASSDAKKIVASFSVVHMSLGLVVLSGACDCFSLVNFG
jgi:hypothetical protein